MSTKQLGKTTKGFNVSITTILWHAVSDCFWLSIIIFVVFVGIGFIFTRERFWEYFPIFFGLFIILLITTVIYPMIKSYFFVKHQEQVIGRRYCECTDFNLPEENREWYIACMGNKLTLINRYYIQKVKKISIKEDQADGGTSKWYQVEYVNCLGKTRKFPLEKLKSEVNRFSRWHNAGSIEIPKEEDE